MKKIWLIALLFISFISFEGVFGASTTTVDVTVTSIFEASEITNTIANANYGTKLSVNSSLSESSGHEFAYFVFNDVVEEFTVLHDFTVQNDMDIKAIFSPNDKHVVLFRDSNGKLLDIEYVVDGGTVSDSEVVLPSKPGYVVSSLKWDKALTNITENTIITLQYDVDTTNEFSLNVVNGSGSGTYLFNTEVEITALSSYEGNDFAYFEIDGQIISRNITTTLTVLKDTTVTAVYLDSSSDAPFVSLSDDLGLRGGYGSFLGHYYLPEGYELVEFGMISSNESLFELSTVGIGIHQGSKINPDTYEYLMSFNKEEYVYVRGYLVFKDELGNIYEIYSDTKACGEVITLENFTETGFEDDSKGAYALGVVTVSGKDWELNDALIGSLSGDQKNDSKSVRLRNGYLKTDFTVSNLKKITFYHGKYGSDSSSSFDLQISTDGTTWYTVDTVLSDASFVLYEFTFTDEVFTSFGLDKTSAYYIRVYHNVSNRINIDDFTIDTGTTVGASNPVDDNTKQTKAFQMTLGNTEEVNFVVGDTLPYTCDASDMLVDSLSCSISGYNMNQVGAYTVTFTATDSFGTIYQQEIEIIVTLEPIGNPDVRDDLETYLEVDYTGYYDGIEGAYGDELLSLLRTIIQTDVNRRSYDEVRYDLETVDEDPSNPGYLVMIYERTVVTIPNSWDSGATWNREHVWPNSRLGVERVSGSDRNIASDLHNLRACQTSTNSSRNNYIFSSSGASSTWYPSDDDRGDVARILFYMLVMYPELTLTDEANSIDISDVTYTLEGAVMGDKDSLITWNTLDSVDTFESGRNDKIYNIQNNRNPFIDYPYLIELIWDYS